MPPPPPPPSILCPTQGAIIFHSQPEYYFFSRSSIGSPWDGYTYWGMRKDGVYRYFYLAGLSGYWANRFGGTNTNDPPGDGGWEVQCAAAQWPSETWTDFTGWLGFQYQPDPPPIPVASFSNSPKEFFESKTVQFNDSSSGNPTSWSWKYRASDSGGAWVEFSTEQNPTRVFSV